MWRVRAQSRSVSIAGNQKVARFFFGKLDDKYYRTWVPRLESTRDDCQNIRSWGLLTNTEAVNPGRSGSGERAMTSHTRKLKCVL